MTPANGFLVLALPFNAVAEFNYSQWSHIIDFSCFRKYIAANTIGWYKFVNVVGDCFAINDAGLARDHCNSWLGLLRLSPPFKSQIPKYQPVNLL